MTRRPGSLDPSRVLWPTILFSGALLGAVGFVLAFVGGAFMNELSWIVALIGGVFFVDAVCKVGPILVHRRGTVLLRFLAITIVLAQIGIYAWLVWRTMD